MSPVRKTRKEVGKFGFCLVLCGSFYARSASSPGYTRDISSLYGYLCDPRVHVPRLPSTSARNGAQRGAARPPVRPTNLIFRSRGIHRANDDDVDWYADAGRGEKLRVRTWRVRTYMPIESARRRAWTSFFLPIRIPLRRVHVTLRRPRVCGANENRSRWDDNRARSLRAATTA